MRGNNNIIKAIAVLLAFIWGCNNNNETTITNTELKESKLSKLFQPEIQKYNVKSGQSATLVTKNGSIIYIGDSTFLPIGNEFELNLLEINNIAEIFHSGLNTMSNNGLLISEGMFRIVSSDPSITINPLHPLEIEYPCQNYNSNMQLFTGKVDADSGLIWQKPVKIEKYLTAFPVESLNFEYYIYNNLSDSLNLTKKLRQSLNKTSRPPIEIVDTTEFCGIYPNYIDSLYQKKYNNTLIATKEFEIRMQMIHRTCDVQVLLLYLDNLDLNLFQIDSLAYEHLRFRGSKYASEFLEFYNQRLTKIKNNKRKAAPKSQIGFSIKKKHYSYKIQIPSFGYYNIDAYMQDPRMKDCDIAINISNSENFDELNLKLIFKNKNVCVDLFKVRDNLYEYRKSNVSNDKRLPLGEQATVLCTAIKDTVTFYDSEEFIIKESLQIDMKLFKLPPSIIKYFIENNVPTEKNSVYDNVEFCCDYYYKGM